MTAIVTVNGITGPREVVLEQAHNALGEFAADLVNDAQRRERAAERTARRWQTAFMLLVPAAVFAILLVRCGK
jgi:hypothetical protein